MSPSYHDLHITCALFDRTSIFNLPYSIEVRCTRSTGWQVWERWDGIDRKIAGEYEGPEKWLVLDVDGHIILDNRNREWEPE